MDENKYWLCFLWLGLAGIFWIGIISVCMVNKEWDQKYIDGGYTKEMIPSSSVPIWVKK